jgi:cycloartenol synthase
MLLIVLFNLVFPILLLLVIYLVWLRYERSRPRRGYGSGENSSWNRRIRIDRPAFPPNSERPTRSMRFLWTYRGTGGTPWSSKPLSLPFSNTALSVDSDFPAVTAIDNNSESVLSGHLVGRQTWSSSSSSSSSSATAQLLAQTKLSKSFNASENPNAGDKLFRAQMLRANGGQPEDAIPPPGKGSGGGGQGKNVASSRPSIEGALSTGWDFFFKLQCDDGHWAGDYGGPLFLLPGLILAEFVAGKRMDEARADAMECYMRNHQQIDGGWGLHIEGPSTLFGTIMNYMALRALSTMVDEKNDEPSIALSKGKGGVAGGDGGRSATATTAKQIQVGLSATEDAALKAQAFVKLHGGGMYCTQWGKFWMAVIGVCDWDAVNPIPPECWLLPRWFPFHPGKMWCHSRMPYLPMSYIYGQRCTMSPISPLALSLRSELLTEAYEETDWDKARNTVADIDLYAPHTFFLDVALGAYRWYEKFAPSWIRKPLADRGAKFAIEYVHKEDLHTNFIDIGPVNKVVNMLACFFESGSECEAYLRHQARVDDYLWVAEDGMKMQGYNGSQLWDTAFATQALAVSGLAGRYKPQVSKIYSYLDATQVKEDVPHREAFFRTISKGGWPFSTSDHGWPIADCTAEGLKATLLIDALCASGQADVGKGRFADGAGGLNTGAISSTRLREAVDVILAFRNPDGGWATYEETRGGAWYEVLNPIESFGDIMIDYTYTELTSSALQGLVAFQRRFPEYRSDEVSSAIARGVEYVRHQQRADGSFYGSWAVCFTYGAWFGVTALVEGGDPDGVDAHALEMSNRFLLSKQNEDGGWGESYLSCLTKEYCPTESSVVNTAWALIALILARCPDALAVRRGVEFLVARQTPRGDWPQEGCSGIFNRTCAITYTSYRNVFPLWAIAAYLNKYMLSSPLSLSSTTLSFTESQSVIASTNIAPPLQVNVSDLEVDSVLSSPRERKRRGSSKVGK